MDSVQNSCVCCYILLLETLTLHRNKSNTTLHTSRNVEAIEI
jgi:hypothetical protein